MVKISVPIGNPFPYEELRGKKVLEECNEVQGIMESTELNWWFSAGTVLGFVREDCGYILHDKDIDLEVEIKTGKELESIKTLMTSKGYNVIRHMVVEDRDCQLAFLNPDNNIIIDFYFYKKEGSYYVNYNDIGVLKIPAQYIRLKSKVKTKEYSFLCPYPTSYYLTYRYGDWQIPRQDKVSWANDAGEALTRW